MAFCVQCGAKLEEGAKFCTVCGARQPDAASPVYVPPTEERPAEPQSYSYTPAASTGAGQQNSYNYDPTIYGGKDSGQNKPPKKKGGAIVFIVLAALVIIGALIYLIAGRGSGKSVSSDDPVLGLYTAQKAETAGISIGIETMWKNGFTIELSEKGKATINVDGEKGKAKWTLDGETFTIKGSGIDCTGTLKDGQLTLEDVMGTGVTLFFAKDGATLPAEVTPTPKPVGGFDAEGIAGLYNADKGVAYGIDIEVSTMWEKGFSIDLKDDGKCTINVDGMESSGSWSKSGDTVSLNVPGFNMDGTITDGVLVFEDLYGMGVDLYFTQDGSMKPTGEPSVEPSVDPTPSFGDWWEGDWYGWWSIVDAGGDYLEGEDGSYVGFAWDACATITANNDGTGSIYIWDQDTDDVLYADVSFAPGLSDKGCMKSVAGNFWNHIIEQDELIVDPMDAESAGFENLICIRGHYINPSNENDWVDYYIILRPWGTRWEDIESGDTSTMPYPGDMMPLQYTNWYLPLIDAGAEMPDLFEGLE